MIDRIVKWLRDFYGLDLNDEMKAMMQPAAHAYGDSDPVYDDTVCGYCANTDPACSHYRGSIVTAPYAPPYDDRGVYYFYVEPGRQSERMTRRRFGKATKGTYRFDSSSGTYYFSKKDTGTAVIIVFTEHGKLKRKTATIR